MRSEFEKWFKTTKIYKDALNLELLLTYQSEVASDPLEKGTSVGINGNLEFYLWSEAESAWQTWNHRQTEVDEYKSVAENLDEMYVREKLKNDELQKRVDELEFQLADWKQKSLPAMINGMCSCCGKEPLQGVVSDKEGYALLHCFGCGANKYELIGEQALKGESNEEQ